MRAIAIEVPTAESVSSLVTFLCDNKRQTFYLQPFNVRVTIRDSGRSLTESVERLVNKMTKTASHRQNFDYVLTIL